MLVTLRRPGLGRLAQHRARTRWYDDRRFRVTLSHCAVNVVPVERAVTGEGCDRTRDLVENATKLSFAPSQYVNWYPAQEELERTARGA